MNLINFLDQLKKESRREANKMIKNNPNIDKKYKNAFIEGVKTVFNVIDEHLIELEKATLSGDYEYKN